MTVELYAAFVAASAVLIVVPGPNVALIVANSVAHGTRYGLLTVAGTSAAMVLQLACTVLGLVGVLAVVAEGFQWLRWFGVAYLLYLGIVAWRAPVIGLQATRAEARSPRKMVLRGFVVSLTNPKTLLFYGAFLPQFVDPMAERTPQLIGLAATFLVLALVLDGAWAVLGGRAHRLLGLGGRFLNRLAGALLIGAAIGLAAIRRA